MSKKVEKVSEEELKNCKTTKKSCSRFDIYKVYRDKVNEAEKQNSQSEPER